MTVSRTVHFAHNDGAAHWSSVSARVSVTKSCCSASARVSNAVVSAIAGTLGSSAGARTCENGGLRP